MRREDNYLEYYSGDGEIIAEDAMWAPLVLIRVYPNRPVPPQEREGDEECANRDRIPVGYVFVRDPKFGENAFWKMPSGHRKNRDKRNDITPLDTAIAEVEEETGIRIPVESFQYISKWWDPARNDHWKCLFIASITEADRDFINDHTDGNEGEKPRFFTINEFRELRRDHKFKLDHQQFLEERDLILPLGIFAPSV